MALDLIQKPVSFLSRLSHSQPYLGFTQAVIPPPLAVAVYETDRQVLVHPRRIRVYHSPDAVDPYSGYRGKACAGYHQTVRAVIKDCVSVDSLTFPLIYSQNAPDHYWRLRDIEGIGEIEGPSIEYHLFVAGTGVDLQEEEFVRAAERICALERALQVRHWARDRRTDEMVLPYFEQTELYQSPFLDKRYGLDREQFTPVVDEFYALQGWDAKTGWPTRKRLCELDLEDVYEPMIRQGL